jgi:hypothetical protein
VRHGNEADAITLCYRFHGTIHQAKDNAHSSRLESRKGGNREPANVDDPFLTGQAFDSKAIREMSLALESACNALGVPREDRAATRLVAEKIVQLAGHGMRGATLQTMIVEEVEAERRKA